jgi:hypothetical protein
MPQDEPQVHWTIPERPLRLLEDVRRAGQIGVDQFTWTDHERYSCQHQQQGRAAIPQCVKVFIPTTVAVPEATLMSRSSPASVAP